MKYSFALISVLAILLASLGAYGYLFFETDRYVSAAVADRQRAASAGQEESVQKTVQTFVSETASQQAELASYVATDASVVSVIQTREDAASREGVSTTIGAITTVPGDWHYHETLEVSLSATGSFAALAAFASDLESVPQASRVTHAAMEAAAGKNWFANFTADFLKEKSATQAAPAS